MGDKLLVAVTPPPKKPHRNSSPKPSTSPLKQPLPSPRNPLSPRFGPLSDTLAVPSVPKSAEKGSKPLSKARSFVFSKSFDETKQFKTRAEASAWSPSQFLEVPLSPSSPLAGRAPVEEQPEGVEDLQEKLKKSSLWRDQYLDLKRLHELIGKIKRDYLHAEQEFSTALAGQVTRVEMFFRRLVGELLQTDRVFPIQYEPEELENFILNIEDYAILNTAILKNVIYFHDSYSMLKLKPSYAWTIRRDDFCQPALLFPLFVRLSAAYHPLPRAPSLPVTPSLKRLQTQPNSNRGIKVSMWIPPNQVVAFVLQVLKYLPLYDPDQFAVPHSTVYFDDSEFRGYQSCVNPESPEAALTCFRWAKDSDTPPEVHIDQKLLEGGRHSTKHIGTLAHSLIGKYLKGGHENDPELACAFEAHPGLIPLQKILTTLRPTLKVEHFRTWFGNHHLKIRLCTQLALLRELDQSQLSKLREWTTPSERIQEQRIHRFPFALVTVRSEALVLPDWLSRLVDKYNNRQDRFSTYPHGVAILYERLATQHGRPSWLSGPLAEVFVKPSSADEKTKDQTAAGYFKHTRSDLQMRTELHRARAHSVSEYMRTGSVDYGSPTSAEPRGSDLSTYRSKHTVPRGGGDQSMLPPITRTDALVQGSPESKDEKREQDPELQSLLPRRLEPSVHKPPPKPAATPAAKLGKRAAEHKTYFANERTYMQWFNAAVLLSTVGLALLSSDHYFLRAVAYLFPAIAILVLCYAYRMYRIRIYTLDNQVPTSKFADMQGPCCLTGIVSCLFLAILILMAVHDTAAPPYLVNTPPNVGVLFGNAANVVPSCNPGFTFPTSMKGIAYNSSTGVLWGVSDSQVFQLFTHSNFTYRFFPQDNMLHVGLMGVAIADQPGLIYVGKHAGQIISVDVATKKVVDVWSVGANMSAFTFVGGSRQNSTGRFYVANTMSDVVKVYALPKTKTSTLEVQSSFVPIPSVQLISAMAIVHNSSELLINSMVPKALVIYDVKNDTAPRLEKVLPGFDLKEVVATTPFSDSQELVLSGDAQLLLYSQDPTTKAFGECLTH